MKVEMTKRIETQCHAELVSAPHSLSIHHADYLSCRVPKQVRDDFHFYNLSWAGTKHSHAKQADLRSLRLLGASQ
ncbi:hypothetical protein FHS10_001537 [Mucilaginibacter dorajii]|nr:hypothetical protein [Mucilaginibacter dorajii]